MRLKKGVGLATSGAIIVLLLAACAPGVAPTPTPVKAPAGAPTSAPPPATSTPAAAAPASPTLAAATAVATKPANPPTVAAPAATPTLAAVATPVPTKPAATLTPAAPASPAPTKPAGAAGDPAAGKTVFDSNCTACHPGGQQGAGPSLVGSVGRLGEDRLTSQIRNGGGMMPGFSASQISEKQLADLIAYLGTVR